MPGSFLHIPALLKPEELRQIDDILAEARFTDGKLTATDAAREVKNNLQVDANEITFNNALQGIIANALGSSPLFQAAVMPKFVYPFLFSKYTAGMFYGWHVDSPVMGNQNGTMRSDIAMTIFLSDPATYTGGELVLQTGGGMVQFKPAKGDAVVYPCQYLHCVNEVKEGERRAAVTWIQSGIRLPEQRQILFNLGQVHQLLLQKDKQSPEAALLLQTHSNLVRMWTE